MSKPDYKIITPPATIGIIGGGQLGQMLAIKSREMGYNVVILDPDTNAPAKYFANFHIISNFDNKTGLKQLVDMSDVITTEFENVPATSLKYIEKYKPVYPPSHAVEITQNRLKEKAFFNETGVKTVDYFAIDSIEDIKNIPEAFYPAILKTATLGYDGKGQVIVNNILQVTEAIRNLNHKEYILEQLVDLKLEASVIVARNYLGTKVYDVCENIHKNGILDITICPARITDNLKSQLQDYAIKIIDNLNYIGVLVIEFFITKNDVILANEMAPRPHNSGHHTLESTITSQFEQQLRAICNLSLGNTTLHTPSVMLNLLGDVYGCDKINNVSQILTEFDNVKLHLYGKTHAKIGRKMGHITALGHNIETILAQIKRIKTHLKTL